MIAAYTHSKDKKIKFANLRAALCINPGLPENKIKQALDFFKDSSQKSKDYIKFLQGLNKKGEITDEALAYIVTSVEHGILYDMESHGWLKNENKFNKFQALENIISRMHKLGLIVTVSDKRGHGYYIVTEKGCFEFYRYNIHFDVDHLITSSEKLVKIHNYVSTISKT